MTFPAGAYIYSKSRFRADDELTPIGGLIIATSTDVDDDGAITGAYRVVCVWRGQYHTLGAGDTDTGMSEGTIRPGIVRDTLLKLGEDETRHRDPLRHDTARRVLAGVLAHNAPAKAGRR